MTEAITEDGTDKHRDKIAQINSNYKMQIASCNDKIVMYNSKIVIIEILEGNLWVKLSKNSPAHGLNQSNYWYVEEYSGKVKIL